MSLYGINATETAQVLESNGDIDAAELIRDMDTRLGGLEARIAAVLELCQQAEVKGITSGFPFTVQAVREAATADGTTEK
jgi:hypothetical protein